MVQDRAIVTMADQ